jgi:hypothetical protein
MALALKPAWTAATAVTTSTRLHIAPDAVTPELTAVFVVDSPDIDALIEGIDRFGPGYQVEIRPVGGPS